MPPSLRLVLLPSNAASVRTAAMAPRLKRPPPQACAAVISRATAGISSATTHRTSRARPASATGSGWIDAACRCLPASTTCALPCPGRRRTPSPVRWPDGAWACFPPDRRRSAWCRKPASQPRECKRPCRQVAASHNGWRGRRGCSWISPRAPPSWWTPGTPLRQKARRHGRSSPGRNGAADCRRSDPPARNWALPRDWRLREPWAISVMEWRASSMLSTPRSAS